MFDDFRESILISSDSEDDGCEVVERTDYSTEFDTKRWAQSGGLDLGPKVTTIDLDLDEDKGFIKLRTEYEEYDDSPIDLVSDISADEWEHIPSMTTGRSESPHTSSATMAIGALPTDLDPDLPQIVHRGHRTPSTSSSSSSHDRHHDRHHGRRHHRSNHHKSSKHSHHSHRSDRHHSSSHGSNSSRRSSSGSKHRSSRSSSQTSCPEVLDVDALPDRPLEIIWHDSHIHLSKCRDRSRDWSSEGRSSRSSVKAVQDKPGLFESLESLESSPVPQVQSGVISRSQNESILPKQSLHTAAELFSQSLRKNAAKVKHLLKSSSDTSQVGEWETVSERKNQTRNRHFSDAFPKLWEEEVIEILDSPVNVISHDDDDVVEEVRSSGLEDNTEAETESRQQDFNDHSSVTEMDTAVDSSDCGRQDIVVMEIDSDSNDAPELQTPSSSVERHEPSDSSDAPELQTPSLSVERHGPSDSNDAPELQTPSLSVERHGPSDSNDAPELQTPSLSVERHEPSDSNDAPELQTPSSSVERHGPSDSNDAPELQTPSSSVERHEPSDSNDAPSLSAKRQGEMDEKSICADAQRSKTSASDKNLFSSLCKDFRFDHFETECVRTDIVNTPVKLETLCNTPSRKRKIHWGKKTACHSNITRYFHPIASDSLMTLTPSGRRAQIQRWYPHGCVAVVEGEEKEETSDMPSSYTSIIQSCMDDGNMFLDHGLRFIKKYGDKHAPSQAVVEELVKTAFLCRDTKLVLVNEAFTVLHVLAERHPGTVQADWDLILQCLNCTVPNCRRRDEELTPVQAALLLKLLVHSLKVDLYHGQLSEQREIRKSRAYKILAYDCASSNIRLLVEYTRCAVMAGEYEEVCESSAHLEDRPRGGEQGEGIPKVLPLLQDLLHLSVNVSSSCEDCANFLAAELENTYKYLPTLEHKHLLIETIHSELLQYKMVQNILESQYTDTYPVVSFPSSVNDIVECFFEAVPWRKDHTPPTTPYSDEEGGVEMDYRRRLLEPSACEEIAMLLYFCISSYLQCSLDKSKQPLRWRIQYQSESREVRSQDVVELWDLPVKVESLQRHLEGLTSELTPATEQYLLMMACFSEVS